MEADASSAENGKSKFILVVDDEPINRRIFSVVLTGAGFRVATAVNGFDALLQFRREVPDLLISDLNMPQMSGFELLSVVRRRFPSVPVIAVSGAYELGDRVPGGVIADTFYAKGRHQLSDLLSKVTGLLSTELSAQHSRQSAPVWIPRNGKDSQGTPFIVLTCTECLRSFPLSVLQEKEGIQEVQETPCLFCTQPLRYIIDFSVAVHSPQSTSAKPMF